MSVFAVVDTMQSPGVVLAMVNADEPPDGDGPTWVDVTNLGSQPDTGWEYDGTSFTEPASLANYRTLLGKLANALQNNETYLGLAPPTNAQVVAQVAALTRQVSAVERIVANQLSSIAGT